MTTHFPVDSFQPYIANIVELLRGTIFFADLTAEELQIIVPYTEAYRLTKGQVVLKEGASRSYLCLIVEGAVDILKNSSAGQKIITQLGAGKTLGEMSMIDGLPFSATAIAAEDTVLILFSRLSFHQISEQQPTLGLKLYTRLSAMMSLRLRQTTDMLTTSLLCIGDLTVALERAIEASHNKTQFVAELSHELRTPLNAILGYSELLEETAATLGHEEYLDDAHRIHLAGQHLLGLINNLLDLTKAEAGKMELFFTEFSVFDLIQTTILVTILPLLKKNQNEFEWVCPTELTLCSDKTKVQQCLLNLLSNASKFSVQGKIRLLVSAEEDDALQSWVVFQVSDTGIGMTPEQVQKLFQPYQQAHAEVSQRYGGTGLGLSLVRTFAQLLGGQVRVESQINQGTLFTLRIPSRSSHLDSSLLKN